MGDHFVLLVDRLLTESTLEAALESRNQTMEAAASSSVEGTVEVVDVSLKKMDVEDEKLQGKLVQCKICHDDDEISNMETPCACSGSLKYAHRKCIQQWCNHKGNTTCEICLQQYKPDYKAFPQLFRFGRVPLSFRGNWEISRRDLHGATQIRVVSPSQNLTYVNCFHPSVHDSTDYDTFCSSPPTVRQFGIFRPTLNDNTTADLGCCSAYIHRVESCDISSAASATSTKVPYVCLPMGNNQEPSNVSGNQSDSRIEQPALQPRPLVDRMKTSFTVGGSEDRIVAE
ncbi:E3 ubiquitin-protein ligase MARCH2 [Senna tora]|uniref:E3 ubiquitin-protein ligase MARCH2 n=1 Tax=Senna tora TaxID=362788 RepID=A0A834WLP7_9FABA|nr:E3 ubiquitin-protein ligase MARCH2 [Senna tora]